MNWTSSPWAWLLVSVVGLSAATPAEPQSLPSEVLRVEFEAGIVVTLDDQLVLEVTPQQGEGLLALTDRVCGDRAKKDLIIAENGGVDRLLAGVRYRVPFSCARPSLREQALQALFPEDRPSAEGWLHRVGAPRFGDPEDLWSIAVWFTGRGNNFRAIRTHNTLDDESIDVGQIVRIPRQLLRPVFADMLPPSEAGAEEVPPTSSSATVSLHSGSPELSFGQDRRGDYAGYRLKAGEALYTSVVVRFTGRLFARDVNPLAHEIARRSGINDLTDIPVGYQIKIPLEYLSDQFLPADDPRRVEYEEQRSASAQYTNRVKSAGLRGVTVILDAGHGGKDVGASKGGIWESVYAYDIMERVKRHLRERTAARVVATTRDGQREYVIPKRDVLANSNRHQVLTSPAYANDDSRISANLRWALSNSVLREQNRAGTDGSNVIFISIHADSLHPSVRGAMAYVPGLLPLRSNYRLTADVYQRRKEVREQGAVSFTQKERVKSLGLSRDLAQDVVNQLRGAGIEIHPNQPIRDRIIRGRNPWVPAVLKYNEVPAKILVEVCNLSNAEDLKLIKTQRFREQFAAALVEGILTYYESSSGSSGTVTNE